MSGDYFYLNSDCLLVTGAVNGAIYCLASGDVYAIDCASREVLELSEMRIPISSIRPRLKKEASKTEIISYLQKLEAWQLGSFSRNPVPPPKIRIQPPSSTLRKIWLELVKNCNLRCVHCYADSSPFSDNGSLSLKQWQAVISEAASLGAKWIQFIGGEPLLYGKRNIFKLILAARGARYEFVEVFTNGTLLDDEYIDFFAEQGVHLALSIYSKRPEIHDRVTQSPGSFQRMMSNVEKLQCCGVPLRLGLVVMKQNCQYEEETLNWVKKTFTGIHVDSDIVCSVSCGRNQLLAYFTPDLCQRRLRTEPSFPKVKLESFIKNKFGHSCLNGELCVQSDGAVYPCIMDRKHILGSVTKSSLGRVIESGATRTIWGLSKDQISTCCDCEYRYACSDCRPLAMFVAEALHGPQPDLLVKDPFCLYDPHQGKWGEANEFMKRVAAKEPSTSR